MSDKPTRSGGGSGLATLPEWPEKESFDMGLYAEERHYYAELSDAALARMEALVEYVDHTEECAYQFGCTCGLSELLAACERSVAAQPSGAGRRKFSLD